MCRWCLSIQIFAPLRIGPELVSWPSYIFVLICVRFFLWRGCEDVKISNVLDDDRDGFTKSGRSPCHRSYTPEAKHSGRLNVSAWLISLCNKSFFKHDNEWVSKSTILDSHYTLNFLNLSRYCVAVMSMTSVFLRIFSAIPPTDSRKFWVRRRLCWVRQKIWWVRTKMWWVSWRFW